MLHISFTTHGLPVKTLDLGVVGEKGKPHLHLSGGAFELIENIFNLDVPNVQLNHHFQGWTSVQFN